MPGAQRFVRKQTEGKTPEGVVDSSATATGFFLAALALSNLVQGAWLPVVPWLNVTLIAPLALAVLVLNGGSGPRKGKPLGVLLLFVSFLPGYLFIEMNPWAGEKRTLIALGVLMVLLVAYLAARSPRILGGFAVGAVILGAVVLAAQWLNPDPNVLTLGRRTPAGLNAIGAGRALGFTVLVCLVYALRSVRRPISRLGWLGLAGVFATGAVAAASRGPLIGLVVGVAGVLLSSFQLSAAVRAALLLLTGGSIVVAMRDFAAEGSRLATAGDSGRSTIFSASWDVAMENLGGIGWGNLYGYLPGQAVSTAQGYNQYPHNVLLEMLVSGGVVAVTLFFAGLTLSGWAAFRCSKLPGGAILWGGFLYALVGAMFSSDVVGNRLLWVVCAMSMGIWGRDQVARVSGRNRTPPLLT